MSLEINYIDAPEGAQEDMAVSGDSGNAASDISRIPAGMQDIPYATLEPGIWTLDGTRRIMPDKPELAWWSSERTDAEGYFAIPPRLTFKFPVPYSSTGISFTFSPSTNQWCKEIHVAWYNGQNLLAEGNYFPDEPKWVLNQTVESFDQMQVELIGTNEPEQFAKLQRVEVGRTILFGKAELVNVRLVNEVDPSLCVLSADSMTFEIIDRKDRDIIPQENQRVELMKDGKLSAVQYIVSSTREAKNQHKITCQSVIGLLEDTFLGGMYNEKPLEELVAEILGPWQFEIAPYFNGTTITGFLPICTQREALQQIAFTIGAVITTQNSTKIRFNPIPTEVSGKFRQNEIFLGASVKTAPRVAKVEVYAHSYAKVDTMETLLNEEEIFGEDVLITFANPHYDYAIEGGTITDSGVNWVKITADGVVTLTGKNYLHTSVAHTRRNPAAVAKEQSNYVSVDDVTIIHKGNVKQALDRLFSVHQMRQTTEQEVVIKNQSAGDLVASVTPWGVQTRGYISSMDSTLTQNGHTAMIYIQGVEVTLEAVWLYSGEIYSGGMEVVY